MYRPPGTFRISHPKVRATSGGVRSVLAARAGAQLQPCLPLGEAGDGNTRRCPDHAEGTCWGNPGHCPPTVLLPAFSWLVRGPGNSGRDGRTPRGHCPRGLLSSHPRGMQKAKRWPLAVLRSELMTLWERQTVGGGHRPILRNNSEFKCSC